MSNRITDYQWWTLGVWHQWHQWQRQWHQLPQQWRQRQWPQWQQQQLYLFDGPFEPEDL